MNKRTIALGITIVTGSAGIVWAQKLPARMQTTKTTKAAHSHSIDTYTLPTYHKNVMLVKAKKTEVLVVFLHGYGGNEMSYVTRRLLNELGKDAYANMSLVFPASSKQSFWHNRTSGPDIGNWADYVANDVISDAINRTGSPNPKIIIAGISMGGYGALHIAQSYPERFCGVAGHTAAIWPSYDEVAAGSFDTKEDFNKNNVITNVAKLKNMPIWLDNGNKDWFNEGAAVFEHEAKKLNLTLEKHMFKGGHNHIYWDSHWPDYLAFYAKAAANCSPNIQI